MMMTGDFPADRAETETTFVKDVIVYGNPTRYYLDDVEVCEEEYRRRRPPKPLELGVPLGHLPDAWPMTSEAAAVRADQIPQAVAKAKRLGVPTRYTADGKPIFTDRGHRKRYLKAHGLRDNSGGYGD